MKNKKEAEAVETKDVGQYSEAKIGITEVAHNEEMVIEEKTKNENKPVLEVANPSFFVKKAARQIVKLDVLTKKDTGELITISKFGLDIDFEKDFPFLHRTVVEFVFSIPNYEDMCTYRQRSSVYRADARKVVVDSIQLRNFLLCWHLKDWNLTDENGDKVELDFDVDGSLTSGSIAKVYAVSPTLLDVVMTHYEKDILIG